MEQLKVYCKKLPPWGIYRIGKPYIAYVTDKFEGVVSTNKVYNIPDDILAHYYYEIGKPTDNTCLLSDWFDYNQILRKQKLKALWEK